MIGIFNGGPWNGYGFPYDVDDLIEFADSGLVTARLVSGKEPLRVRAGAQVEAGDTRVAVYRSDPEMTRLHGWAFREDGIPVRCAIFTFDRRWTEALGRN
jgi:hypothetical protein